VFFVYYVHVVVVRDATRSTQWWDDGDEARRATSAPLEKVGWTQCDYHHYVCGAIEQRRRTNDDERGPDDERAAWGEIRDDRYDASERDAGFPTRGDARAKLALWTL
jgi:hypothetical protein